MDAKMPQPWKGSWSLTGYAKAGTQPVKSAFEITCQALGWPKGWLESVTPSQYLRAQDSGSVAPAVLCGMELHWGSLTRGSEAGGQVLQGYSVA